MTSSLRALDGTNSSFAIVNQQRLINNKSCSRVEPPSQLARLVFLFPLSPARLVNVSPGRSLHRRVFLFGSDVLWGKVGQTSKYKLELTLWIPVSLSVPEKLMWLPMRKKKKKPTDVISNRKYPLLPSGGWICYCHSENSILKCFICKYIYIYI